jgi:membrane fusion protein (multidrug efflux system)
MADPALKSEPAAEQPGKQPADPVLKVVPPKPAAGAKSRTSQMLGRLKDRRRPILLIVLPALAAIIALTVYLMGGRYISTDNAYVGAQKVLITPDVAGKVINVFVREGQHVNAGDRLFEVDPTPYKLAATQAEAKLATVETQFKTLKSDYQVLSRLTAFSQQNIDLKKRDVERKNALVESRSGSQADMDKSAGDLVTAQLQNQLAIQRRDDAFNQLLGNPELPIEQFPAYAQAKAVLDQARIDLKHTMLIAPIGGIATQVDNIQLGRFIAAGGPILSVVDDAAPWVDANPKETDITYLRLGQRVTIEVDTFTGHKFHGSVVSVAPGTGAQFSILPVQNATGNWIKVVQRVPLRIAFDQAEDTRLLRSGMSAVVEIDTGRNRSILTLLGLSNPKPTTATSVP